MRTPQAYDPQATFLQRTANKVTKQIMWCRREELGDVDNQAGEVLT